jgi:hypothetical protein
VRQANPPTTGAAMTPAAAAMMLPIISASTLL